MSEELGACLHCKQPLTAVQKIGRCVYGEPCGCRQYQGNGKDAAKTLAALRELMAAIAMEHAQPGQRGGGGGAMREGNPARVVEVNGRWQIMIEGPHGFTSTPVKNRDGQIISYGRREDAERMLVYWAGDRLVGPAWRDVETASAEEEAGR